MSEKIQHDAPDALEEAITLFVMQEQRGVPQITTAVAAALLIGKIIGSAATDREHLQEGLDHLAAVMNATGADWLQQHAGMMKN